MTNTKVTDIVLKADRKGRVRTPVERRAAILEEYDRSGMSGQAFAAHYGIKYSTFASWLQKRRHQRTGAEPVVGVGLRMVEAMVDSGSLTCSSLGTGLRIELPGGACLEMNDERHAGLVAQLLRALAGSSRPC